MFCPNCGTQNPEAAPVCGKCNFNLKAAAAPKFKGTMLMMNQPGATPGSAPPAPPTPSGGPPRPIAAPTNKLKGTMVGVAPPMPPIAGKPGAPSAPNFGGAPQNYAPPPAQQYAPPPQQQYAPPPQQNFAPPPQQQYAPPPQQQYAPPQQQYAPPPQQQNFAPPVNLERTEIDAAPPAFGASPQAQFGGGQGVNPLGGTMAADGAAFNPYAQAAQPQGGYGGAPAGGGGGGAGYGAPTPGYGAPPPEGAGYGAAPAGAPQGFGAPPQPQYGSPQGYGAPQGGQGGFGAPQQPQQGFGNVPQQPAYGQQTYGQPGAPMQTYGQPAGDPGQGGFMMQASAGFASAAQGGTRPIQRNALMTILMPFGCLVGATIISILFGIIARIAGVALIATLGSLVALVAQLAGIYFFIVPLWKMTNEVKSVTNNPQSFATWMVLIPIYGPVILLPAEVANAKRIVGAPEPVRSPVLYFFVSIYALALDVNEIAARMR